MRGPLERIRRRVKPPDERPALTNPADAPTTVAASADDRTRVPASAGGQAPISDAPAGLDPGALERQEDVRRRGRARRRLRFLERARELLLRDLGGLVFEIHRSGEVGRHDHLVAGKVQRLLQVDAEARELAETLGRPRGEVVLRTPGLGGTCPRCGELHGSEAHFCSHCGLALSGGHEAPRAADAATRPAPASTGGSLFGRGRAGAGTESRDEARAARGAKSRDETGATQSRDETGAAGSASSQGRTERAGGSQPAGEASSEDAPAAGADPRPRADGPNGGSGGTEDTEVITVEVHPP